MVEKTPRQENACLFCGAPPTSKTKEHVIPRWLIALTGDPKRQWYLGVKSTKDGLKEHKFSADQFQFPACESCNNIYSRLEDRTKANIERLLNGGALTAREWDDLLDWFDKVRIGVWLGMRMLNKNLPLAVPKFHVDQRIGVKDRCVLMYHGNDSNKGLRMHSVSNPVFYSWPSCFGLTINSLVFINASSDFMLAARMGFPFPRKIVDLGRILRTSDYTCLHGPKVPFIRIALLKPLIEVYQCILGAENALPENDTNPYLEFLNHASIRARLLSGKKTKSLVHSVSSGSPTSFQPDEIIKVNERPQNIYRDELEYAKQVFALREYIMKCHLKTVTVAAPERKGVVELLLKVNRADLQQVQEELDELKQPLAQELSALLSSVKSKMGEAQPRPPSGRQHSRHPGRRKKRS
jgi:hypothetical protein